MMKGRMAMISKINRIIKIKRKQTTSIITVKKNFSSGMSLLILNKKDLEIYQSLI